MKDAPRGGEFIPATREVEIARGVVYRPVMSWHSGNFAGLRVESLHGDRSGCVEVVNGRELCSPPKSVCHRHYWHPTHPDRVVSVFLSYPYGLGGMGGFWWEAYGEGLDAERFTSEQEMEERVSAVLAPH